MKKLSCLLGVVLLSAVGASAATETQKGTAILSGWAHLDYVQCKTPGTNFGAWGWGDTSSTTCSTTYADAFTGAAVFAFLSKKAQWPNALATQYGNDVTNGINYLLSIATVASNLSVNNAGQNICPGGAGTCKGIYWNLSEEPTYCTGFVATAIGAYALTQGVGNVATTTGPLAGMTWTQIGQGITNAYAAAQGAITSSNGGPPSGNQAAGGWRYSIPADNDSDMSTTQWGAIATGYDESIGAVTPAVLKPALRGYLAYQITGNSAPCYLGNASNFGCDIGPTNSENGAWLVSNAYTGQSSSIMPAINWMNTNWNTTANSTWNGNFGHTYAMWSSYKGLEATIGLADNTHITNLYQLSACQANPPGAAAPSGGVCNWWEDYNQWLVNNYGSMGTGATDGGGNGYWTGYTAEDGWSDPMSTSVFVSILAAAALPTTITSTTPTVPAISEWGLVALAILLVVFAALKLRGPQTT